jgi:drug/metabolite transporter (DMT)-like permease
VIPDSPITGPETSRRLSHPVLLRGAFYAKGYAVTFGVITSLAKFTYDHGASPQTAVWSRILAAAVLMGGWHVLSSRKRKPLNTPVASEKTLAALPVLVVAISVAVMSLGYLGSVYFIPVSFSTLLFFTFPFVSQHNNAGKSFFSNPAQ